jgi:hypothetical protein
MSLRSEGCRIPFCAARLFYRAAEIVVALEHARTVMSTYLSGAVPLREKGRAKDEEKFDGWAEWDGSSFAAALVSGAIAARTKPGRVPARQAWQDLLKTAEESKDGGPPFLRLAAR